jgi:hypothetical protein
MFGFPGGDVPRLQLRGGRDFEQHGLHLEEIFRRWRRLQHGFHQQRKLKIKPKHRKKKFYEKRKLFFRMKRNDIFRQFKKKISQSFF